MKRLSDHLYDLGTAGADAPPALLFPFAGGSVHAMREFADLLPGFRHLAVHYPARGFRGADPPAASVEETAAAVAAEFAGLGVDAPLLVGHSMGAYAALEVGARLAAADRTCLALLASSSPPPGVSVDSASALRLLGGEIPLDRYSDEELTSALVEEGGLPPDIVDEPDLLELVLPVLRHDFALAAGYARAAPPTEVHCPVLAFGGTDDPAVPPGCLSAWADHTTALAQVHVVVGDHFWFRDPHPEVAAAVAAAVGAGSRG